MSKSHKRHCSTGSRIHDQSLLEFCDKIAMSPMYMSWSPCAWHQQIRALSHVPMHQKQGTCAFPMHSCILIPNETKIVNCAFAGVKCVAFHNQVKKPTNAQMHLFNFVAYGCQRQWSSRLQSTDDLGRLHRDEITRAGNFERRIEKIRHPPQKYGHKMHTSCNNHKCSWDIVN
jgi:hypothetical protein